MCVAAVSTLAGRIFPQKLGIAAVSTLAGCFFLKNSAPAPLGATTATTVEEFSATTAATAGLLRILDTETTGSTAATGIFLGILDTGASGPTWVYCGDRHFPGGPGYWGYYLGLRVYRGSQQFPDPGDPKIITYNVLFRNLEFPLPSPLAAVFGLQML